MVDLFHQFDPRQEVTPLPRGAIGYFNEREQKIYYPFEELLK